MYFPIPNSHPLSGIPGIQGGNDGKSQVTHVGNRLPKTQLPPPESQTHAHTHARTLSQKHSHTHSLTLPLIWNALPNSQFQTPVWNSSHIGRAIQGGNDGKSQVTHVGNRIPKTQLPPPDSQTHAHTHARTLSQKHSHTHSLTLPLIWNVQSRGFLKLSHPTSTSTFQIPQFPIPTACREIPNPAAEREIPIPSCDAWKVYADFRRQAWRSRNRRTCLACETQAPQPKAL
jgi:hypothetical protein